MPLFDIQCRACGRISEVLVFHADAPIPCPACGSEETGRLMSPTSSLTGKTGQGLPGHGDTTCCGGSPAAGSCAGPGSCCGKTAHG